MYTLHVLTTNASTVYATSIYNCIQLDVKCYSKNNASGVLYKKKHTALRRRPNNNQILNTVRLKNKNWFYFFTLSIAI